METKEFCPDCDELLRYVPTFNQEKKRLDEVYVCHECNLAWIKITHEEDFKTYTKDKLYGLPFNAKMELLNIECNKCKKISHFRQYMLDILQDNMIFKIFCIDCAIEFIKNAKISIPIKDIETNKEMIGNPIQVVMENVNNKMIFEVVEKYNEIKQFEVMNDPKKYQQALNNPEMQELLKKFDEFKKKEEK
jgi:hypothetical protein